MLAEKPAFLTSSLPFRFAFFSAFALSAFSSAISLRPRSRFDGASRPSSAVDLEPVESSVDVRVAALAEANLLVPVDPDSHPGRRIALLADHLDRGERDAPRPLEDAALGVGPVAALADVPLDGAQTLDPDAERVMVDGEELSPLAGLVLVGPLGARHHLDQVAHLQLLHGSLSFCPSRPRALPGRGR